MNKQGQIKGLALILIAFLVVLTLFGLIESFKENLNANRGYTNSGLNCPGTASFNQTAYNLDANNTVNFLTRRPTCFVTGLSMVWFVGFVLIALVTWLIANWRNK